MNSKARDETTLSQWHYREGFDGDACEILDGHDRIFVIVMPGLKDGGYLCLNATAGGVSSATYAELALAGYGESRVKVLDSRDVEYASIEDIAAEPPYVDPGHEREAAYYLRGEGRP